MVILDLNLHKPSYDNEQQIGPTCEKISSVDASISRSEEGKHQVLLGSSGKSAFSVVDTSHNSQIGQLSSVVVPVPKPSSNLSQEQSSAQQIQRSAFIETLRVPNQVRPMTLHPLNPLTVYIQKRPFYTVISALMQSASLMFE